MDKENDYIVWCKAVLTLVKKYNILYNYYMNNVELKLNMLIKEMDHLWNGMFIVGGGAFAFLAYEPNLLRIILAVLGFGIFLVFGNAYLTKRVIITNLLNEGIN